MTVLYTMFYDYFVGMVVKKLFLRLLCIQISYEHFDTAALNGQLSSVMQLDSREALCMDYHVCTSLTYNN